MNRNHIECHVGRPVPKRCARGTVSPRRRGARPMRRKTSTTWHGRVWKPVRPAAEIAREAALFSELE